MTIFRVKHLKTVIKPYDKHQRILRTEIVANEPGRFGIRKRLSVVLSFAVRSGDEGR